MDCQDLLETERVQTEILNVADSKRPAQDSHGVFPRGNIAVYIAFYAKCLHTGAYIAFT